MCCGRATPYLSAARISIVAGNRASAQRDKLDAQTEARAQQEEQEAKETTRKPNGKHEQRQLLANRRANTTIPHAIEDYLQDHAGGNHSDKTLEWHRTALGLMRSFMEQERGITLVGEVDATDISAWFAHMRTSPGGHGKPRSERTIQTYARSARAFFHWLMRQETLESNPFDRVVFPKVGKPLIQTIEAEEFERLLVACTPSNESGLIADRAAARNRAILWVLYDTGIRISELCGLRRAILTANAAYSRSLVKAPRNGVLPSATTACATSCTTWISTGQMRKSWQTGVARAKITSFSQKRAPHSPKMG
jgi:site-specific recombinase XerD